MGFELGRLKTGTPPRLKKSTIDWDALPEQLGDEAPTPFSDLTDRAASFPSLQQIGCRQTSTTAAINDLIRANIHRAPMFSGQIASIGPRYCPSIEDKVVRFAERDSHGVFLEPESLRDDWVYCNGISTSLPADVQDQIVRLMPGCEKAHIYRYGYAVEYDMVRPHQIHATGHTRLVEGLFLAGQINGTSGYEEAAAQGLVAGINAAHRALGRPEFILGRDQAYIGVLMDDLVTKTPVEPYRMFTSRAEHRLLLRADNAPDRLTPLAVQLGLLDSSSRGERRRQVFAERRAQAAQLSAAIDASRINGQQLSQIIRGSTLELMDLKRALGQGGFAASLATITESVWETVFADRRYEPYLVRQHAEIKRQAELEHRRLPEVIDYRSLPHLRAEARQALAKFRPRTFGQAGRLEGMTPADLTLLSVLVARLTRPDAGGGAAGAASPREPMPVS